MSKNNLSLMFLLFFTTLFAFADVDLKKKYSDIILTEDYGILKEQDILIPIQSWGRESSKWQCFPMNDVKLKYETWKDTDAMGLMDSRYEYSLSIKTSSGTHFYFDRHGQNYESFWKIIYPKWMRIKKSGKHLCLNGMNPVKDKDDIYWFWDIMITKSRCFSYFANDCYTKKKMKKHFDEVVRE
jgi:hypothetical protein